jgi:pimeloyl-ACP methyl ester carboxylesterase
MTPVVVVHGLWMPGAETWLLRRRLRKAGFEPFAFRYPTVSEDLTRGAARLESFLASVPGGTRHLLGHSLGGLVILEMLKRHAPPGVGRLVLLGSPLCGSAAARNLLRYPGGRRLLGRAMAQCLADGGVRRWAGPQPLGVIAGSRPVGLGRLLGPLALPHDGTVAVAETRIEGAADHLVLPVTHLSMLWSAAVADQAVQFLREGRFAH